MRVVITDKGQVVVEGEPDDDKAVDVKKNEDGTVTVKFYRPPKR